MERVIFLMLSLVISGCWKYSIGNIDMPHRSEIMKIIQDRWSEVAIPIAAPFAASEILTPEIWQAISILVKGAK